jgi:hypothetical protein
VLSVNPDAVVLGRSTILGTVSVPYICHQE